MSFIGDKFHTDMRGIHAEGVVTENGFTVLAGSGVRNHEAKYLAKSIIEHRHRCLSDGTIVNWKLVKDIKPELFMNQISI